MRTVQDLVTALRTAADTAPEPFDILGGVAARRRRRTRRRHRAAFAAAAVVTIVVAGTLALRGAHGAQPIAARPAMPTTPATQPSWAGAPSPERQPTADEVWPEAVFLMPKKAADGSAYRLQTAISPTEVLVMAEASFEKAGRIEVYDLKAHTSRVVVPMPQHPKGYFEQGAVAGDTYIAWWGTTPESPGWADFWVAPREGGAPVKVGEVRGGLADVDQMAVTRDHVIWSPAAGGVYRMPISGGAPERIPGTDGLWLTDWPSAVDVRDLWYGSGPPSSPETNQSVLADLKTGARKDVGGIRPAGVTGWRCSTTWCYGSDGQSTVISRTDGSAMRTVPGLMLSGTIHGGRFAEGGAGVYDLATGRTGQVMARTAEGEASSRAVGTSASPTLVYYWNALPIVFKDPCAGPSPGTQDCVPAPARPGKDFKVLNLAAIPPPG
ncbi:hypothetical protein J5X84_37245 [Streptosporangiaceae bacterium NEAU-GS5]|nr:hypothetical protein [Streptosporangiaceae bacterium NEAU-GS5]